MAGRVAVLGGTGLLGGAVARALLAGGRPVTLLARRPPLAGWATSAVAAGQARLVLGAADDRAALRDALTGAEHVVHAVGCPTPAASAADPAGDLGAVRDLVLLLEELRARPGTSLTLLSSGGAVYGAVADLPVDEQHPCRPVSPYGVAKLAAEQYVLHYAREHGLPSQVLRVANAYGPEQRPGTGQGALAAFLAAAAAGTGVVLVAGGAVVRDFVHADDVGEAVAALLPVPPGSRVLNVGSGSGTAVGDLLALVRAVTGRPVPARHAPARAFDPPAVVLDTRRLAALVPWRPRPLDEGVAATWAALRQPVAEPRDLALGRGAA